MKRSTLSNETYRQLLSALGIDEATHMIWQMEAMYSLTVVDAFPLIIESRTFRIWWQFQAERVDRIFVHTKVTCNSKAVLQKIYKGMLKDTASKVHPHSALYPMINKELQTKK